MARAMTLEAKEEKKAFIIKEAFKLYENSTFNDFRMIDLAQACNMSKGILFKYFKTKEILFFNMLDIEYKHMLDKLEDAFSNETLITVDRLKDILARLTREVFDPNTTLVRLTRIKNVILEQNVDYDFAVKHKVELTKQSDEAMRHIVKKLSGITGEQFAKIFSVHSALLYGYLNNCSTSEVMKKVIKDHGLSRYEIDPIEETIETLSIFIDGYLNKK